MQPMADGGAAPHVAAAANGVNLQRLGVVAVVVFRGRAGAVGALVLARRGNQAGAARLGDGFVCEILGLQSEVICGLALVANEAGVTPGDLLNNAATAAGKRLGCHACTARFGARANSGQMRFQSSGNKSLRVTAPPLLASMAAAYS